VLESSCSRDGPFFLTQRIDPIGKTEAIFALKSVTFHYKNDNTNTPQFGLIVEEVAKVNPALTLPDKEGKPYTVRYEQINATLLNEFIKEHKKSTNWKGLLQVSRQR
jgi:hypothetical protein